MDLDGLTAEVDELLADADEAHARQFPGAGSDRGPIQTLYVAAGDFHADHVRECGREAEQAGMQELTGQGVEFGRRINQPQGETTEGDCQRAECQRQQRGEQQALHQHLAQCAPIAPATIIAVAKPVMRGPV